MSFRSHSLGVALCWSFACGGEKPDAAPAFVDLADDGAMGTPPPATGSNTNPSPTTPVTGLATDVPLEVEGIAAAQQLIVDPEAGLHFRPTRG